MSLISKIMFTERVPLFWMAIGCLLIAGVGFADFMTGNELSFSLFYLIPVVLVAWILGRTPGLAMSVIAAIVWVIVDILDGPYYSNPMIHYWNGVVRLAFFATVALLLPALKALEYERRIARTDYLTGAANRRHFFEQLQSELDRSQRYKRPLTLVYIDLDGFKSVNDRFGHRIGDKLLCTMVGRAKSHLRKTDLLARLGGDEFILLLPEIGEDIAREMVPKIQSELLDEMQQNGWPVTFSIGTLTYRDGSVTADTLVKQTDHLMYSVKNSSKNAIAYETYTG
ncbi:MAG: diguanylate cyclase [Pseudomonadota bacterium]